eukprot:scaffold1283_cov364-Pavlova_lutheri.AAC.6
MRCQVHQVPNKSCEGQKRWVLLSETFEGCQLHSFGLHLELRDNCHRQLEVPSVAPNPLEAPVLPRLSFDDEEYALNRKAFERFSIILGPFTGTCLPRQTMPNVRPCLHGRPMLSPENGLVLATYGHTHPNASLTP